MPQLVTTKDRQFRVRDLIQAQANNIQRAVPRGINPDRFARVATTTIIGNEDLLRCTPVSLIGAMLQAAQWGLELDPVLGLAYLVPYKTTATLIPGYQGLMELARRSGKVLSFDVAGVHEADTFKYRRGLNKSLTHIPALTARGKLIAVYAIAYLTHDSYSLSPTGAHPKALTEFEVMNLEEVDAIRERSRAGRGGPWVTDYEAMAKKTVVRRLCKILPRTPELARALHIDEEADRGDDQTLDIPVINLPEDDEPGIGDFASPAKELPAPADDPLMAMMREKAAKAARPALVRDEPEHSA